MQNYMSLLVGFKTKTMHVVSDLASAEDQLPVCAELADDTWDEQFISELGPKDKVMCLDDDRW